MDNRRLIIAFIPVAFFAVGGGILLIVTGKVLLGCICLVLALLSGALAYYVLMKYSEYVVQCADNLFYENSVVSSKIVKELNVPCLLYDASGRIIWSNNAMKRVYPYKSIRTIIPDYSFEGEQFTQTLDINGRYYNVFSMKVKRDNPLAKEIVYQYWVDLTEAHHYRRIYEERLPAVALIYMDNYDELMEDKHFNRRNVLFQVEKRIESFAKGVNGIYRKFDTTRFIVVFESAMVKELERGKFALLSDVRQINTGTPHAVSLSIAVGAEERLMAADESAREAMEMALGRGGDQAVLKRGAVYTYYGGTRSASTKTSQLKTKLFAKALRQMMENSSSIFIMGHKRPDMDALGAALGLFRCASLCGRPAYIVIDEPNDAISVALKNLNDQREYMDVVITPEKARGMIKSGSMLIIVDSQRLNSLIDPDFYNRFNKKVVIDHHRRAMDVLSDAMLTYLESGASSTCEIVTEIMQNFDETPRPTSLETSCMLAGIIVDTRSFTRNTGNRTFEAAGFLRRNNADMKLVKLMFQDDIRTYMDRAKVVQSAQISKGIAIAVCPPEVEKAALICAQAADELIEIKGINASFVLVRAGDAINISARSFGDINVQLILEKLGGGGHLTVAGAQLKDVDIEAARAQLTGAIDEYLKDNAAKLN